MDNAYFIPVVRARGWMCKTNLPTNTAFRGSDLLTLFSLHRPSSPVSLPTSRFGGPQSMLIAETWMQRVAETLKLSPVAVREKNMYKEGQQVH